MRIPVFARRSNPAIDKPILRKNLSYGEEQVRFGVAEWVDPLDPSKGIVALEMLLSGRSFVRVETVSISKALLPPLEPNGCKVVGVEPTSPVIRWMTQIIGKQTPKRFRMEAAALKREAAAMTA